VVKLFRAGKTSRHAFEENKIAKRLIGEQFKKPVWSDHFYSVYCRSKPSV